MRNTEQLLTIIDTLRDLIYYMLDYRKSIIYGQYNFQIYENSESTRIFNFFKFNFS